MYNILYSIKEQIILKQKNEQIDLQNQQQKREKQQQIYKEEKQQIINQIQQTKIANRIIPLNIFQTWHTLNLPQDMNTNMLLLKQQNPEFTHYLYNDDMCRDFISNNFNGDVLYAYDTLKPGAYKSDLWRYCILYKYGGIYLDIKYKCCNNFKFIYLIDKEYFCRDWCNGVYQGFMCCLPNNQILYECIKEIIINTKTKSFTINCLSVSGPHLYSLTSAFNNIKLELKYTTEIISKNNIQILFFYKTYRNEQKQNQLLPHYKIMWANRDIYNYIS